MLEELDERPMVEMIPIDSIEGEGVTSFKNQSKLMRISSESLTSQMSLVLDTYRNIPQIVLVHPVSVGV